MGALGSFSFLTFLARGFLPLAVVRSSTSSSVSDGGEALFLPLTAAAPGVTAVKLGMPGHDVWSALMRAASWSGFSSLLREMNSARATW